MPWNPLRSLRRRYRERQTEMALLALDDAQLKDFGIYRGAIPWSVRRLRHTAESPGGKTPLDGE